MTVPYQFANATGNINLAELDANFDSLGVFATNAATVTASAQPNVTSLGTLVSLQVTGNIRSVNGFILGDGRFLTNLPAANGTYGNANVASYLPTYDGNLAPNTINSTNITTANLAVTNTSTFARSVAMSQALQVTGDINSYGNVIGRNFVSASGNANVANVNANAVSTVGLTATGLVTVGTLVPTTITGNANIFANFITANSNLTVSGRITSSGVVIANQGFTTSQNVQANNVTASNAVSTATVNATGNITGGNILATGYFYANGQPFTGSGGGTNYSNANVASFLAVNTGPINGGNLSVALVSSNGNISGANISALGNVTAAGIVATNYQANANIYAGGTLTAVGAAQVGSLATNGNVNAGNVIATSFVGSGAQLTGISGPIFMSYLTTPHVIVEGISPIIFNTTSINTNNFYNTTTGRFTPLVPGYYQINVSVYPSATGPAVVNPPYYGGFFIGLIKNTQAVSQGNSVGVFSGWGQPGTTSLSTMVYLNGTTDYIYCVIAGTSVSTGAWILLTGPAAYFQATWVHA